MKNIDNKINILDCTLRDGGYYNNWEFNNTLINEYLAAISHHGIKYVELGFRGLEKNILGGPTATTSDKLIDKIKIPNNLTIGVMVNVSDFFKSNEDPISLCKTYFKSAKKSKIKFVRLASHLQDVYRIKNIVNWFKKNEYIVFLNIMQISEISNLEIKKVSNYINKTNVDILYLADSLGSINPNEVKTLYKKFRKIWKKEIGIHAHDNLGYALKNSKIAAVNGATWIDCTVTGMGRGPGNVKTEELLKNLRVNNKENHLIKLNHLIKKYFTPLKRKYKWGKNYYYALAAKNKIHPTYIQDLISDKRYKKEDYIKIINNLKKTDTRKFNPFKLYTSDNFLAGSPKGKWTPKNILKNKNLLILGPGTSVSSVKNKIENFIKRKDLFVIAINTASSIEEKLINLRIVCHPLRILSDALFHSKSRKGLIVPFSMLPSKINDLINTKNKMIYDFGLSINKKNKLTIKNKYCILQKPLAIEYALAVAISGQVNKIFVAGFDGFKNTDPFMDETNMIFKKFNYKYKNKELKSLTKTRYKLELHSTS